MGKDARDDLLRVPVEDGRELYGGHDRHVAPESLGDGYQSIDAQPIETLETTGLAETFLPGQEFRNADEEL